MAKKINNGIVIGLTILLFISISLYFIFGNKTEWLSNLIPEFIGIAWFGLMVALVFKLDNSPMFFIGVLVLILLTSVLGLYVGVKYNIEALVNIMPEFIGTTFIGVIFSILFHRKVVL